MRTQNLFTPLLAAAVVLAAGQLANAALVSYWSFDSDFTASDNTYDGTGVGDAAITNTAGEWKVGGGALSLGGTQDYLTFSEITIPNNNDFTIAAWINSSNMGAAGGSGSTYLFGDENNANQNWSRASHDKSTLKNATASTENYEYGTTVFQENVWEHIAIVRTGGPTDSDDITIYHNGTEINLASGFAFDGALPMNLIGARDTTTASSFPGFLDELYVYDEALSESQIQSLAGIPEPSSLALLCVGALVIGFRRRV